MNQSTEEEECGYELFPERAGVAKRGFISTVLLNNHFKCQNMLLIAMEKSPYAKVLLSAMKSTGCEALRNRHFSCEECDGQVSGGFDAKTSQVVLCQNNIHSTAQMERVLAHELIHAFDHCRAHVDWFKNYKHLACSEIRAANLSGDCSFSAEFSRFNFGMKQHHQECVRERALNSILAVRKIARKDAVKIVDEVFDKCFNDHTPFGRIPHSKMDASFVVRERERRHRYYTNL